MVHEQSEAELLLTLNTLAVAVEAGMIGEMEAQLLAAILMAKYEKARQLERMEYPLYLGSWDLDD